MKTQNFYLSKVKLNKLFPGYKNKSMRQKMVTEKFANSSSLKTQIEDFLHILSIISFGISFVYGGKVVCYRYLLLLWRLANRAAMFPRSVGTILWDNCIYFYFTFF